MLAIKPTGTRIFLEEPTEYDVKEGGIFLRRDRPEGIPRLVLAVGPRVKTVYAGCLVLLDGFPGEAVRIDGLLLRAVDERYVAARVLTTGHGGSRIKVLGPRILAEKLPPLFANRVTDTPSELEIITLQGPPDLNFGKVKVVDVGVQTHPETGAVIPIDLAPGDLIPQPQYGMTRLTVDDVELMIIKAEDVTYAFVTSNEEEGDNTMAGGKKKPAPKPGKGGSKKGC